MLPVRARRNLYLFSIAFGLPAVMVAWWFRYDTNAFIAVTYPVLALHLGGVAVLLWRAPERIAWAEWTTSMLALGVGFGRFAFLALFAPAPEPLARLDAVAGAPTYMLILLIILGYVSLPIRPALLASGALVAGTTAVGVAVAGPPLLDGDPRPAAEFAVLTLYLLLCAAFVYVLARTKEALARAAEATAELAEVANTDRLTELPNRRRLEDELERRVALSERHDRPLSVVTFDLDHFKRINDTYGHEVGDELLCDVGVRIGAVLRTGDLFGRWGGEEFLIVAPETDLDAAAELARRCAAALRGAPFRRGVEMTASFGVASWRAGESAAGLLRHADEQLYRAKREGRDRVCA